MKKWRKCIFAFIVMLILAGAAVSVDMTAYAAEHVTEDGFHYLQKENDETVEIVGYSGSGGNVRIPDEIDGMQVVGIGESAFSKCKNITSIIISDNVASIGDYAFYECGSLNNIVIPDSVVSVGEYSFGYCSALTDLVIPDSVTSLGACAFYLCDSLSSVTLSENLKNLEDGMFYSCRSLDKIILPDSIKSIGDCAFENCSSLAGLYIPEGVTNIGSGVFWGCKSMNNVYVPQSVTDIDWRAFTESRESDDVINKKITLYVVVGSYAHTYARQNGMSFSTNEYPCIHKHLTDWMAYVEPTCLETGIEVQKCIKCDKVINSKEVPDLGGHIFSEWQIEVEPACKTPGIKSRVCSRCNKKEEAESQAALGHDYQVTEFADPTCIQEGYRVYTCSNCNDSYSETMAYKCKNCNGTGHLANKCKVCKGTGTLSKTTTVNCASCSGTGKVSESKSARCFQCKGEGMYFSVKLQRFVVCEWCSGTGIITADTETDCSSCGGTGKQSKKETVKCGDCTGGVLRTTCGNCHGAGKIPYKGNHSYGSWVTETEATCTADGVKTRICSACQEQERGTIAKTGHRYVAVTNKNGVTEEKCSICGEVKSTKNQGTGNLKTMGNIKAVSTGYDSSKITWERDSSATGYEIYRSTSKNKNYKKIKTITKNNTTAYADKKLITGKTYYYKIRAYKQIRNNKQYGGYSRIVSAKPVLSKTTVASVKNTGTKSLIVKWKKVKGANGYEVYRATAKNGKYGKVKTVANGNPISFKETKLAKGKTYYYKVKSYRKVGKKKIYSAFSNVKSYKVRK